MTVVISKEPTNNRRSNIPQIALDLLIGLNLVVQKVWRVCQTCVTFGGTLSPNTVSIFRYMVEL